MSETNDLFMMRMFEKLGFEDFFNAAYQKGVASKANAIDFQPAEVPFGSAKLTVLPKVEEEQPGNGFYLLKGYFATRMTTEDTKSQFFSAYKSIGFHIDQANEMLRGAAVRHVVGYDEKKNEPVYAYSQIDFTQRTKNDNFKINRRNDDGSIIKALSLVGIVAKPEEKQAIYSKIQMGQMVPVTVRRPEGFAILNVQAAVRKQGQGIDLFDSNGQLLRQFPEEPAKRLQPLKTLDEGIKVPPSTVELVVGQSKENTPKQGRKASI